MMKIYTLKKLLILFSLSLFFIKDGVSKENNLNTHSTSMLAHTTIVNPLSTDTDGDLINDAEDLDDDNDGIPDENECGHLNYAVYNGGFEDPVIKEGSYKIMKADKIPGWETTASDDKIEIWSSGFLGVSAQEGNQFVELNANQVSTLYQTYTLNSLGGTVTWSLYHRGRQKVETANVRMGADLASATLVQVMTDGTDAWGYYSGTYTIAPGQTTLVIAFESIVGGSIGNFLDDIRVNINQACIDSDGDGITNDLDLDSDNDGITDLVENAGGNINADNGGSGSLDGRVYNFTDVDLDGWNDTSTATLLDTDGDGIPDFRDLDSDGDGILDYVESVCSNCPTASGPTMGSLDSDMDGVLDMYENMSPDNIDNTTGTNTGVIPNLDDDDLDDTIPDYLDEDSDGDGINDWIEGFDLNGDSEATDDLTDIAAIYEANNGHPGNFPATDNNNDGIPDWLEHRISVLGNTPASPPPFASLLNMTMQDDNYNGVAALFDIEEGGVIAPIPNLVGAVESDWREARSSANLPVDLVRFESFSTGCQVEVEWTSKTEEVFNFYELEKSTDGSNFQTIKKIYAQGGDFQQDYSYTDRYASGQVYYRLKMVDIDGTYEYSDIIMMITDCTDREQEKVLIYPNPIAQNSDAVYFKFLVQDEVANILLIDQAGVLIQNIALETNHGWNSTSINIDDLAAGIYQVSLIRKSGKVITKRLVIVED